MDLLSTLGLHGQEFAYAWNVFSNKKKSKQKSKKQTEPKIKVPKPPPVKKKKKPEIKVEEEEAIDIKPIEEEKKVTPPVPQPPQPPIVVTQRLFPHIPSNLPDQLIIFKSWLDMDSTTHLPHAHVCSPSCLFMSVQLRPGQLIYVCRETGNVHECGRKCNQSHISQYQHICAITGLTLGSEYQVMIDSAPKVVANSKQFTHQST